MQFFSSRVHRFIADESGVALVIGAMLGGLVIPIGVTAYYFVQLSSTSGILDTACQRVLAGGIRVQNPVDRDLALKRFANGLLDEGVIENVFVQMKKTAGVESYTKGDPESDRPVYELLLKGNDVAGRSGSSLGKEIEARCKAKLELGDPINLVEEYRRFRFVAGNPPAWVRSTRPVPIPGWGKDEIFDALEANPPDIRLYVEREINGQKLLSEVWRRREGVTQWLFPADTDGDGVVDDRRMTGSFVKNTASAALLNNLAATYLVDLTVKNPHKTILSTQNSGAKYPVYPAIKPVCVDETDPNDPGLGWEIDPDLLPGGSGTGEMGKIYDDLGYKYFAVVGVGIDGDGNGKYKDDFSWDKWDVRVSVDGGLTTSSAKGTTVDTRSFTVDNSKFKRAYTQLDPEKHVFGYRNYNWRFGTKYTKELPPKPDGTRRDSTRGGIHATLYQYELQTTVMCPGTAWERLSIPIKS